MPSKKEINLLLRHRFIIKIILNLWTVLTFTLFIIDFFSGHRFDTSTTAIEVVYLTLLGIYISDKEYERWRDGFHSRFFGEFFVIAWTLLMVIFVIITPMSDGQFKVPQDFAVVYASVIAAFAISQHSKALKKN